MPNLRYSIEKIAEGENGESTYRLTYAVENSTQMLLQKEILTLNKEDANGTVFVEEASIPAASIASYKDSETTSATLNKHDGFAINVSDSNLAVGGTYYEIESTVGTYADPNAPIVSPVETIESEIFS